jgi:hypothetical protein
VTEAARPDLRHELTLLVLSRYPLVVLESSDEAQLEELVRQVAIDLSLPLLFWTSSQGLVRAGNTALVDTREPDRALARIFGMGTEVLAVFHDLHPYLERPEIRRRLREADRVFADSHSTIILTGVQVPVPPDLASLAARLEIALPELEELRRLVETTARKLESQRRVEIDLTDREVEEMAIALKGLDRGEARRVLYQAALRDGKLAAADLPLILESKRKRVEISGLLEWVDPLPGLTALGGLDNFKSWIGLRAEAYTEAARRFRLDPPRGLLLTGVPGTGKSMAARAVAGEWNLPLLRLDVSRLYDKFIGQTEANLRRALTTAEATAPAVLWIDEIEKALATGAGGTADGGLSERILGSLLTWMQERTAQVFLIATANDIDKLPVESVRRGRFDEVFFVDLPAVAARKVIFALHLQKRGRSPEDFDLDRLAHISEGFSGAEIEGVVVAALYHAFSQRQRLSTDLLLAEIASTRPLARLRPHQIQALRAWGQQHAVPA